MISHSRTSLLFSIFARYLSSFYFFLRALYIFLGNKWCGRIIEIKAKAQYGKQELYIMILCNLLTDAYYSIVRMNLGACKIFTKLYSFDNPEVFTFSISLRGQLNKQDHLGQLRYLNVLIFLWGLWIFTWGWLCIAHGFHIFLPYCCITVNLTIF